MNDQAIDLGHLFQSVSAVLNQNREALNQADVVNGNHGDHMVEIFRVASLAALEKQDQGMDEAMQYAALLLRQYRQNASAQVYARGLSLLSEQFGQRNIQLSDLIAFARRTAKDSEEASEEGAGSGDILKALLYALAAWDRSESNLDAAGNPLGDEASIAEKKNLAPELSYMFSMGMTYLQAKGKGGDRVDILADTVVSASPLGKVPHRALSGRLVFTTLLKALMESDPDRV